MMVATWQAIRSAARNLLSGFQSKATKRRRLGHGVALRPEWLERRDLLAANTIIFDPGTSSIVIEGTSGADDASVWNENANTIRVSLTTATGTIFANFDRASVTMVRFTGGDGNDRLNNATAVSTYAWGGGGDDRLIGGTGSNTLYGGSGNDELRGNIGVDYLYGEDGADALFGDRGNDVLVGGAGEDQLIGGDGNDLIFGEGDDDYIEAGAGNDRVDGGAGDDYVLGGAGDDTLIGGAGNDELLGGDGNDTLQGGGGNDALTGGAGNDRLEGGIGNDVLRGGVGDDLLYGDDGHDQIEGDDGNDFITGDGGVDVLSGGAGHDYVSGGEGNDQVVGGDGNDYLLGDGGNDFMSGGDGIDFLDGGIGDDYMLGGAGNDHLIGGEGSDTLNGEDGNDRVYGDAGNDVIRGDLGNDWLVGGGGDDIINGGLGDDVVYGGDGNDQLTGDEGNDFLSGEAGDDRLEAGSGYNYLTGGAGKDQLVGGDDRDVLVGGDDDDFISGGAGDDDLYGGAGNDYILGGVGDDRIDGEEGDDEILGESGNDWLSGGAGVDVLLGGLGDDYLFGGAGNDHLRGGDGMDQLRGDDGDDYMMGEAGADVLIGGRGIDTVYAGLGNDVLIGGEGKDLLHGNEGDDILLGGSTIHDDSTILMRDLVLAWSSGAAYATRVELIESAGFTARLKSADTVLDDQILDDLYGNEGQDWFIKTGYLAYYRPEDSHHHHGAGADGGGSSTPHGHAEIIVSEIPALEGFALIDTLDTLVDRQTNERIHSLVPHSDNTMLQREHLSLFQLVRYDQVTHIAMRSGNWSDPSIWQHGQVPGAGARVLIPIDVSVVVDGVITMRLATVRVDGTLSFDATRNTEMRVDTVVVSGAGAFEMGTYTTPIGNNVTARLVFTNDGPIDTARDPFIIGRGLISHGRVSIRGAAVTSYAAFNGAAAGTRVLNLNIVPQNWKVGDSVVIASTVPGTTQNEVRTIAAINGSQVTLNQPLTYNHTPPSAQFEVHVAHLNRNVIITSESGTIERRGHVMFMHERDIDIAFARFERLGRTNKFVPLNDPVVTSSWTLQPGTGTNPRARYPVHFHRNGLVNDGNPSIAYGNVVVDAPGWGFVNHSSYVDMVNNVAYGVVGAGFATEVGDEIGGFYGNIAIGSTGTDEEINAREFGQDFGFQGDGFWFQGAGVSVAGNIAAGNHRAAFVYYTRGLVEGNVRRQFLAENLPNPEIAQGQEMIPVGLVPVRAFTLNVGYGSYFGLKVRYHLEDATHGAKSVFENSKFWNNTMGIYLSYTQNSVLRKLTVVDGQTVRPEIGIGQNLVTLNITYDDLAVSGFVNGIDMPRRGNNYVNGGTFTNNIKDILVSNAAVNDRLIVISGALSQPKIATTFVSYPLKGHTVDAFFVKDTILLNFGPFAMQRLYGLMQAASAVPFPVPREDAPEGYINRNNQYLKTVYGKSIGGEIAPSNAFTVPYITGLIAPAT